MRALAFVALLALTGCTREQDRAEQAAADLLIDPESAKFRKVENRGGGVWCGEINGKNRMGAYSGYNPFMATVIGSDYAHAVILSEVDDITFKVYFDQYKADCLDADIVKAMDDAESAAAEAEAAVEAADKQ